MIHKSIVLISTSIFIRCRGRSKIWFTNYLYMARVHFSVQVFMTQMTLHENATIHLKVRNYQ